jgi:uncharacterized pyridoxal phosphate-containing UPF0001 family protein
MKKIESGTVSKDGDDNAGSKRHCGLSMKETLMGMSGDFEIAVVEGATMVRVGSLFSEEEIS